jgi:molybdopterin-guanine dinucleotide biosynthesis protein A
MSGRFDNPHNTTLAVLAGGSGKRMGVAKATLQIQGEPILSYLIQRLRWPGPTLLVTAPQRTSPAGAELFNREAIDRVEGQGPLRGILTALENTSQEVIVITVDMPAIILAMLERLIQELNIRPDLDGVMFEATLDGENRVEPFPSIFRQSARDSIARALADNRRSIRDLLHDPKFAAVAASNEWPASVWTNLNTPEDVAAFENSLGRGDKM